jgi:hypothetical protein
MSIHAEFRNPPLLGKRLKGLTRAVAADISMAELAASTNPPPTAVGFRGCR